VQNGTGFTRTRFLAQVHALAQRLPDAQHAINLCEDRVIFAMTFCAVLLRGQINLLPGNASAGTIGELLRLYPRSYVLSDKAAIPGDIPSFIATLDAEPAIRNQPVRQVPAKQLAAIAFTSGTTGKPRSHEKTWGTLVEAARLSRAVLLPDVAHPQVIATVPPQHMYGLEFSVFWPLVTSAVMHSGKPFFPADLRDALAAAPSPRVLATTPVHLRACLRSGLSFPEVALVISATAPLPGEWAAEAEDLFGARVMEIYGCTEGGSLASRRTSQSEAWTLHPELELFEGRIRAPHYPELIDVQDELHPIDDRRFTLAGRGTDMIKVAGKRASLAELTQKLLAIEGIEDGIVFLPNDAERPAALVVAPQLPEREVLARLAEQVDAVFLPRPLRLVAGLPRNELGKLPVAKLMELLRG
jgi:acyl-coenzyme A synthetase/AMP-(fatty) acid ligase